MATSSQIKLPTAEAVASIQNCYDDVQRMFPEAVRDFEKKWATFQEAWQSQAISVLDFDRYSRIEEFDVLKRQGPKIIPFVVQQLAKDPEQNCYGVFVYNALETDGEYRVNTDHTTMSKEALVQQCGQIIELNYKRNKIYDELVRIWKDHCNAHRVILSQSTCCEVEEYFDLVEVGPSLFAPIMVEYANDRGGYWYELLHELVHGHGLNTRELYNRPSLFDVCHEFLNGGEWDKAPKYQLTEWEVYLNTGQVGPQMWKNWQQFGYFHW